MLLGFMGKIGVVTVNDFNNYGNRLQCYAVQAYLERLGHSPENIFNKSFESCIHLPEDLYSLSEYEWHKMMQAGRSDSQVSAKEVQPCLLL